jgi:hypothetical protein
MIGMDLHVVMVDGTEHTVPITYRVAVDWEDSNPGLSPGKFLQDVRFKPLASLAWHALKRAGITVKPFTGFIDELEDASFVPKGRPADPATTPT